MSTTAISPNLPNLSTQQYIQQRTTDLQQLGEYLQAGDLTDAQTEFNDIQTLGQNGPFANGEAFCRADRQQDFNAIGQALQSGDLSSAQQAYAQLKATFHAGPELVLNLANAPAGEQITIGLDGGPSGTKQVAISASNPQSQNPEQITLNLNPSTNEQIVLNLFNNGSSSQSQSSGVDVSA